MSIDLLKLVGVMVVIVLAATAFILIRRNAENKRRTLVVQKDIQSTLQRAHLNRTQMDVQIEGDSMSSRFLRGPCAAVDSARLLIDTNLPYSVNAWIGQKVHVYFQFRGAGGMEYYDFYSVVTHVLLYKTGYALELGIPKQLNNNQKRTFVRLEPPSNLIEEVMVWYVPPQQGTPGTLGTLRHAYCAGEVKVEDISAGGVRVRLSNQDVVVERFNIGDQAMTHLVAGSGEGKEPINLWLLGEVVLMRKDSEQYAEMSLKFRKWAAEPAEGEDFAWFPVEKGGGVPPLAVWVMLRHLEVHRTLGSQQQY